MFPFSVKLLITGLFSQITTNIFSVLLGKYYSVKQVGFYSQGNKWMTMGGGLISGMLTGVAQPVFAQVSGEKERQVQVLRKMIRFAGFISFPVMFGLALIAHEFILLTVTAKWLPSVPILQLLCIWGAFSPICELYKSMIISMGKSDIYLWANVVFGIVQLLVLFLVLPYGIHQMVVAYVGSYLCWLFAWHCVAHRLIHIRLWDVIKDIAPYLIITFGALGCAYFIASLFENIYLQLIIKMSIAIVLYVGIMWITNSVIFKECVQFILNKKV